MKNESGRRYGSLVVLSFAGLSSRGHATWRCSCACGREVVALGFNLRNGNTGSCGCARKRVSREKATSHGRSGSRLYLVWAAMLSRCRNPRDKNYPRYGGRGISVCDRWLRFEGFYADMHPRPDGLSLDRVDNDGGYSPENCRWATRCEQGANMSRSVRLVVSGASLSLSDAEALFGVGRGTIYARLRKGWSHDQCVRPVHCGRNEYGRVSG